jgi:hypothetical protein
MSSARRRGAGPAEVVTGDTGVASQHSVEQSIVVTTPLFLVRQDDAQESVAE